MLTENTIRSIWLGVGIAGQALIAVCLVVHLVASRRARAFVLPRGCLIVGTFAIAVLAVYAAARHDAVFLVGQILFLIMALRVLAVQSARERPRSGGFPVVAPDRADADHDATRAK